MKFTGLVLATGLLASSVSSQPHNLVESPYKYACQGSCKYNLYRRDLDSSQAEPPTVEEPTFIKLRGINMNITDPFPPPNLNTYQAITALSRGSPCTYQTLLALPTAPTFPGNTTLAPIPADLIRCTGNPAGEWKDGYFTWKAWFESWAPTEREYWNAKRVEGGLEPLPLRKKPVLEKPERVVRFLPRIVKAPKVPSRGWKVQGRKWSNIREEKEIPEVGGDEGGEVEEKKEKKKEKKKD